MKCKVDVFHRRRILCHGRPICAIKGEYVLYKANVVPWQANLCCRMSIYVVYGKYCMRWICAVKGRCVPWEADVCHGRLNLS